MDIQQAAPGEALEGADSDTKVGAAGAEAATADDERASKCTDPGSGMGDASVEARAAQMEEEDAKSINIGQIGDDVTAFLRPMPVRLPAATASPAVVKLYDQLLILQETSGELTRKGAQTIHDILRVVGQARYFRTLTTNVCLRTLRFFLVLARIEKKAQAHTSPGTLMSLATKEILKHMDSFCSELKRFVEETRTPRADRNRESWVGILRRRLLCIRLSIRILQTEILHIDARTVTQPLSSSSAVQVYTDAARQLARIARRSDNFKLIKMDQLLIGSVTLPFLAAIQADSFPGYISATHVDGEREGPSVLIGNVRRVAPHELQPERLPLESVKIARQSMAEGWVAIRTIVDAIGAPLSGMRRPTLAVLYRLLVNCFNTNFGLLSSSGFAELIVTELRACFDLDPSPLNRWRLTGALAVLSVSFKTSRQFTAAVHASAQACQLFQPLCNGDIDAMMTELLLLHCSNLVGADTEWRTMPQPEHQQARLTHYTAQAVQLGRRSLLRTPASWESQLRLGRALMLRTKNLRNVFAPSAAQHSILVHHRDEAFQLLQSAAQNRPLILEPWLCYFTAEEMRANPNDFAFITSLGPHALTICDRWMNAWPHHFHLVKADLLLQQHRYSAAELAATIAIDLLAMEDSRHSLDYMERARIRFKLGRVEDALRDVQMVEQLSLSKTDRVAATALVYRGYATWLVGKHGQVEDAVELLDKGVRLFKNAGYARQIGDGGTVTEDYVLGLCWFAAAQCATSEATGAQETAQLAIDLVQHDTTHTRLHKPSCLARALLFSAAVLLDDADGDPQGDQWTTGRARLMDAVELIEDGGAAASAMDDPTKRTVWLLLAHMLEEEGRHDEAEQAKLQAGKAGFLDYAHRLGLLALDTR
ncbi:hypothetical protein OC842_003493 [Tilletia horrida]|uniref:Uncharacterized protein n=1 Tax=Tilletia horrida TaxID=155126 RepID=A0AAN6GBB6_9BASI|nr:hypothetical protein OC842_003493 [Tilletia horrida]